MCSDQTSSGLQLHYYTYLFCVCVHAHMHSDHTWTCDCMRICHGTYVEVRGITSLFCHVGPRMNLGWSDLMAMPLQLSLRASPHGVAAVRTAVFNAVWHICISFQMFLCGFLLYYSPEIFQPYRSFIFPNLTFLFFLSRDTPQHLMWLAAPSVTSSHLISSLASALWPPLLASFASPTSLVGVLCPGTST